MSLRTVANVFRGAVNIPLDYFGINDSVISTFKRLGKYGDLINLLNQIYNEIENNDIKISDLKTALQSESPLGIAYKKMNNLINTLNSENRNLKETSGQIQRKMAKVDTSDVFNVGSNIKELDSYATKMENYFKE